MARIGGRPIQIWRRLMAMTRPRERALNRRLRVEFARVARLVSANLLGGLDPENGMSLHEERIKAILLSAYTDGMPVFAKPVLDFTGKADVDTPFEATMRQWINTESVKKVGNITKTTRAQLKQVLAKAAADGLGTRETAKAVRSTMGGTVARARSSIIARTEIHTAANAAQLLAAKSLGLEGMNREWIAAQDERTRDDHRNANGQTVGMNQPFVVGNELLMFPGDPNGAPEQTINCRCTTAFAV